LEAYNFCAAPKPYWYEIEDADSMKRAIEKYILNQELTQELVDSKTSTKKNKKVKL
jgi:hypothetical protein